MYWIDGIGLPKDYADVKKQAFLGNENFKILNKCVPFGVVWAISEAYDGNRGNYSVTAPRASRWYIKENFKFYKQVYIVNNIFLEKLKRTKNLEKIPKEVLKKLPFDSFYIDVQNCGIVLRAARVCGFFVSYEKFLSGDVEQNFLNISCVCDPGKAATTIEINLNIDGTIKDVMDKGHFNSSNRDVAAEFKNVLSIALQIIMYMTCDKKDIVKLKAKKPARGKEKEPTFNQVGFNIGKEIERQKKEFVIGSTVSNTKVRYEYTDSSSEGVGSPKSPHFRAAHWAIYHVGEGRKETVLKWIDTIYVHGGDDEEDKPITLHNIV